MLRAENKLLSDKTGSQTNYSWVNYNLSQKNLDLNALLSEPSNVKPSLMLDSLTSTALRLSLRLSKKVKNSNCATKDENYLQISLPDRVFVYDLNFDVPRECFSCF